MESKEFKASIVLDKNGFNPKINGWIHKKGFSHADEAMFFIEDEMRKFFDKSRNEMQDTYIVMNGGSVKYNKK